MSYFLLLTTSTLLLMLQLLLYVAAFAWMLMVLVQLFPLVLFETLNYFTLKIIFYFLAPILLCIVGDIWRYISGVALLQASRIHHFVYGEWQGSLDIQDCLDGIFKILQLDPSIALLQQHELDQILCSREAPALWTRSYHFPPIGDPTLATLLTCCGPWHNGAGHFVTFYMCPEYRSILDPLEDVIFTPTRMQRHPHCAL
jgi:hypothetical protein